MEISQEILDILSKNLTASYDEGYKRGYAAGYTAGLSAAEDEADSETQEPLEEGIYPIHDCIMDISAYQKDIDFDELCANTDFVILRARVCTKTDTTFEARAAELNKRGMPFAVYDYATLMSKDNAKQQAEAIYNLCEKYHPTIYYIDTEQLGTGVSYANEYEYIKVYVNRLRELGVKKVGQYTGDWKYSTYYKKIQDLFDTLWIARYGKNNGEYDGCTLTSDAYTDKIDLHQYTDKGVLPGIPTKGDRSRLTGKRPLSYFTGRKYE